MRFWKRDVTGKRKETGILYFGESKRKGEAWVPHGHGMSSSTLPKSNLFVTTCKCMCILTEQRETHVLCPSLRSNRGLPLTRLGN